MQFLVIHVVVFAFFSLESILGVSLVSFFGYELSNIYVETTLSFDMNENCFCLCDHSLIYSFFSSTSINHNCYTYICPLFLCCLFPLQVQVLYQKPESLKEPVESLSCSQHCTLANRDLRCHAWDLLETMWSPPRPWGPQFGSSSLVCQSASGSPARSLQGYSSPLQEV